MPRFGVIPRCSGCAALLLLALITVGCRTSSLHESLQVRSDTRLFWHGQRDVSVGIGFRELNNKATEISVVVRNNTDLPVDVPALTPETVRFYVNGTRLKDAQAGKKTPTTLKSGEQVTYKIKHRFVDGKSHRVFASVSMPGSLLPRERAVSPEVLASALFGAPPTYQASRWLEE